MFDVRLLNLSSLKNHFKRLLDDCLEINTNQDVMLRIIFQSISGAGISLALEFDKQLNDSAFFGDV